MTRVQEIKIELDNLALKLQETHQTNRDRFSPGEAVAYDQGRLDGLSIALDVINKVVEEELGKVFVFSDVDQIYLAKLLDEALNEFSFLKSLPFIAKEMNSEVELKFEHIKSIRSMFPQPDRGV